MEAALSFINTHHYWLWGLAALSLITFLGSLAAVPWLTIQLPEDYFTHQKRRHLKRNNAYSPGRLALIVGKNALGGIFFVVGIIMLMTPGQGLLTILIGITLLDFPGKYRFERWLVSRRTILRALNKIRAWAGRQPLIVQK